LVAKGKKQKKTQGDNKYEQKNAIVEANPIVESIDNVFNVLWSTADTHDHDGDEVEKKKNPIVDKTPNAEAKNAIVEALDSSTQHPVGSMDTAGEQTNDKEVPRKAKHHRPLIAKLLKNFKKANKKKSKSARTNESEQSVISDITDYTRDNEVPLDTHNEVPWDAQEQIHPVAQLLTNFFNELYSTIVDDVHYGVDNGSLVNNEKKTYITDSSSETAVDANSKEISSTKKQESLKEKHKDDEVVKFERTGEKSRRFFGRRFFNKKEQRSDSEPLSLLGKRKAENGNTDDKQMKKKVNTRLSKKVKFPFKGASKNKEHMNSERIEEKSRSVVDRETHKKQRSFGSTLSKKIQFPFQRTSKKDSKKPKCFNEELIGGFYLDRKGTSKIYRGRSELAADARFYEGDMARCDQRNGTGTKWIPINEEAMKLHWHCHHMDPI